METENNNNGRARIKNPIVYEEEEVRDILTELIETNQHMAGIIDKLFLLLIQHIDVDNLDKKVLDGIKRSALTMADYE